MMLFLSIYELLFTYMAVFILCELCERLTNRFVEINDLVDQFDWYLLPFEIQQLLPMIMANTQQPLDIVCFGSLLCNRDTFKKVKKSDLFKQKKVIKFWWLIAVIDSFQVVKSAFSYFMVLRKFDWMEFL